MNATEDRSEFAERKRIREQCKLFESAWGNGLQPLIEAHLEQASEPDRPLLLCELTAVEIELRRERGENPSFHEYRARFPDDAATVDAAFAHAPELRPPAHAIGSPRQVSNPDTARDLLFGILALQNNFIDRGALLSAFNAWTADKSRPLGLILVELGKLDNSRRVLLNALVAEHLKVNGDDPDRSLAVISSLGPIRRDLEQLADADLAVSLGHVGTSRPAATDPETTLDWVGTPTSGGARFRVLRLHARGGLGEVFAAFDEELHREVALKLIQDHHADDPDSRARFVQEAEITGSLEHPGIVPVYGLGQYDNGRPFYAMRMVKGDSLRTAIKQFHEADQDPKRDPGERTVSLRRLLGRFLDVCDAVRYAHSRGVLHRDLKPNNILLGKYGETLIIDWGLAKVVGRPDSKSAEAEPTLRPPSGSTIESTRAGSAIGTPGFMSPEQARGDIDKLGPASDVFSLGATLYHLLTGRPAFDGDDFAERLQKNQRCEFSPPRAVKPSVPRPLEAICLKAMAPQPGNRYPSPRSLAEDIEHWLADEPVSALPETWSQKTARWARRHRAATQAAASVLVVISAVSIISALLINLARHNESRALVAETYAKVEAQEQRKRAEDGEQLAIDAVRKSCDAVVENPELQSRDELTPLRESLLKEPLEFFRELRDKLKSSPDTRPEALSRLGLASYDLARTTQEIGSTADAIRVMEDAADIQERLVREHPDLVNSQAELARSYFSLGSWSWDLSNRADALRSLQKSTEIWAQLADNNPGKIEFHKELAVSHLKEFWLWLETDLTKARALIEAAQAIYERLARANANAAEFQSEQALLHYHMAALFDYYNDRVATLDAFQKALAIRERLVKENPRDFLLQLELSATHRRIGREWTKCGKPVDALKSYQVAALILEQLMLRRPGSSQICARLVGVYSEIGKLLEAQEPAAALEFLQKALLIREKLVKIFPDNLIYQTDLAGSYGNIGQMLDQAGRRTEALKSFEKAMEIYEGIERSQAVKTQSSEVLLPTYDAMGNLLSRMGRPADALDSYRKAKKIGEGLVRERPNSANVASELGNTLHGLALLETNGDSSVARETMRQALAQQKRALSLDPGNFSYHNHLINHLIGLHQIAPEQGVPAEAIEAARELTARMAGNPTSVYDAACILARCVTLAKDGAERDRCANDSMQTLRAAAKVGWSNAAWTTRDPDLVPLHDRDDFQHLVGELFDCGFPANPFAP